MSHTEQSPRSVQTAAALTPEPAIPAPPEQAVSGVGLRGTGERPNTWWKRNRFWLICTIFFLILSLLGFLLGTSGERTSGTLSITNPAPAGAQAAAAVLGNQGVAVTATDSLAGTTEALFANGQGNSTVLFYDPRNLLSPNQVRALASAAQASGAKLVAIAPGPLAVKELSTELSSTGTTAGTAAINAGCINSAAVAAGTIDGGSPALGTGVSAVTTSLHLYKGPVTCFVPAGTAVAAGGYLASNSAGTVAVLGNPGVVINQNLASRGNAALTFRLLGSAPHLLWYMPSLKDIPAAAQPPSLAELTPQWIFPASTWLLLVAVLGMLWRGRRHGPLVTEPLPVIVKASETLTGRARLYQDARALDTATRTLQHATLTRLARTLRLGNCAEPAAVVQAITAVTGRKPQQVNALLLGAAPTNEKDMLSMAVELTALEEEVAQR